MKSLLLYFFSISFLVFPKFCFANEIASRDTFFIQIEENRFSLKNSNRSEVEAFFGTPSKITFFERGGEDFYWTDFTVCDYKDESITFYYNREGYVVQIVLRSNYDDLLLIQYGFLKDIDFNTMNTVAKQLNARDTLISRRSIVIWKEDQDGDVICMIFWFDENSKISRINAYYEKPW